MDVRQRTEEIEHMTFAPWATFSDQSRGRMLPDVFVYTFFSGQDDQHVCLYTICQKTCDQIFLNDCAGTF